MNNSFKYYLNIIFFGILFLFLQTSIFNPVPIFNVYINLLFIFSLTVSIFTGFTQRLLISIFCGLLIDLWFTSCSFYTLSFLLINNIAYFVFLKVAVSRFPFVIIAALSTFLVELLNASLLGICYYDSPFSAFIVFQESIAELVIGNTIFAFILYPIIKEIITPQKKVY